MNPMEFDKATFKKSVMYNVKNMFRRTIDEATPAGVSGGCLCGKGCNH